MSRNELIKRYILFIVGLFFSGIGVAFSRTGELGVTPISSIANVLSYKFTFFTIGNWLIVTNCLLIVGQILVLKKKFNPIQFLQIPLSFLFGWFTDFGMWMCHFIPVNNYPMRLVMLALGIVILAFGIFLTVTADVILNSGEAMVKAISDTTGKPFGNVKVVFDISFVSVSVIFSLIFFGGKIVGTREGTIISAVFTGMVVKLFNRNIDSLSAFLFGKGEK